MKDRPSVALFDDSKPFFEEDGIIYQAGNLFRRSDNGITTININEFYQQATDNIAKEFGITTVELPIETHI